METIRKALGLGILGVMLAGMTAAPFVVEHDRSGASVPAVAHDRSQASAPVVDGHDRTAFLVDGHDRN